MAAKANRLSTQLKSKLNSQNVSLEERLDLARIAFTSTAIPIHQKEDFILDYLIASIKQTVDTENKQKILKALHSCLKSHRMKCFTGVIRPSVVTELVKILEEVAKEDRSTFCLLTEDCIVEVLKARYLQRLLACDVTALCKLMSIFFSCAGKDSKEKWLESIQQFLFINKLSLLKDEMRNRFTQETLVSISASYVLINDDNDYTVRNKIVNCVAQIVLFEPTFLDFILNNATVREKSPKELSSSLAKIKELPSECEVGTVSAYYTLLLRAVVSTMKFLSEKDYERLFKVFETLSTYVGLQVDKVKSVSIAPVKGWNWESSFIVISDMIRVLDEAKTPLRLDFEGYSLETWLTSLVIGMTSINLRTLTPALLYMNEAAFRLNPLIIEACTKVILPIMFIPKEDATALAYKQTMLAAIDGTQKVKRLQKFIALILGNLRATLTGYGHNSLTMEQILPLDVRKVFSEAVETLSHSQALSTMRALLFHLECDSLSHVEVSDVDITVVVNTEIIVELITQLINGVKFADISVADIIKAKFKSQLEDLQNILRKFEECFALDESSHNDRMLSSFLKLCHTNGAINLLLDEYESSSIKPCTAKDLKPTNLCYVHPYLTAHQWQKIFHRVINHEGCLAKDNLLCLLVQKIAAVAQIEEGTEGPGSQAARFILQIADLEWMWSQLVGLSPLLEASELYQLTKHLVKSCKHDQSRWKALINQYNDGFLENRRLVLSTGLSLLYMAGKRIKYPSSNRSITTEAMSQLMVNQLLEYELSLLLTEDLELEQEIEATIVKMSELIGSSLSSYGKLEKDEPTKLPCQSYFEVVKMLPLHHFSVLSQSCVLLSLVSLLIDLPRDDSIDIHILDVMHKILDGPKSRNHKLLGHLHPGWLLKFLSKRAALYPFRDELMSRVCMVALSDSLIANELIKSVSKPKKKTLRIMTMVMQAVKKAKNAVYGDNEDALDDDDDGDEDSADEEQVPRKKSLNKRECINNLIDLALPILLEEQPCSKLLPDYAVILKYKLSYKNSVKLNELLSKLKDYAQIAVADYADSGSELAKVMMSFRQELGDHFPKFLVNLAWTHLLNKSDVTSSKSVADLVFSSADSEEFKDIVSQLLAKTKLEVKKSIEEQSFTDLDRLLTLWSYLVQLALPYEKHRLRADGLISLVEPIVELMEVWSTEPASLQSVPSLLEFILVLVLEQAVELKPITIDTILLTLSAVPFDNDTEDHIISRLHSVVRILFSLYLFRNSSILERLPAILQRYRLCLMALAPLVEPSRLDVGPAMTVAGELESFARSMVKNEKQFKRVAPYIIADVLNIFGKFRFHADIKNVYTNIIFAFLSICDCHAIPYLKSVLPSASKELFKNINDNYSKHHKFIGKI